MGVVLDVSFAHVLCRSAQWRGAPPSPVRGTPATRPEKGGCAGGHCKVGVRAHLEALVRDSFAQSGTDIRTVQELLGHSDVSTTMIYTHVLKVAAGGTASPLDSLFARPMAAIVESRDGLLPANTGLSLERLEGPPEAECGSL